MRELELIEKGLPTKQWRRLDESVELPIQVPEDAA
jgi:hypothetical protein